MDLNQEIFRVIIRALGPGNLPEASRVKIIQAIYFFEDAFKSNFFKNSVLSFGGSPMGFNKKYNLGLTNEQVYVKLLTANEVDGNMATHIADLFLEVLFEPSDGRTIGFVRNNSNIICTYNEFLLTLNVAILAGHFAHEWTHLIGFGHR